MAQCIKEEPQDSDSGNSSPNHTNWEICESWIPKTFSRKHLQDGAVNTPEVTMEGIGSGPREFVYDAEDRRHHRELICEERKDKIYWAKRLKNNDSARRSRLKKKIIEQHMEEQLKELQRENMELKYELATLKRFFCNGVGSMERPSEHAYSESRHTLNIPSGSVGDVSESSSVTSDDETCHVTHDTAVVAASPLTILTAGAASKQLSHHHPSAFMLQQTMRLTPFPFKYSFLNTPSTACKGILDDPCDQDNEVRAKVPHKFRLKRDFHSAFTGQAQYDTANA